MAIGTPNPSWFSNFLTGIATNPVGFIVGSVVVTGTVVGGSIGVYNAMTTSSPSPYAGETPAASSTATAGEPSSAPSSEAPAAPSSSSSAPAPSESAPAPSYAASAYGG